MVNIIKWMVYVFVSALVIPIVLHFLWLFGMVVVWEYVEYPFKNVVINVMIRLFGMIGLILGTIIYNLGEEDI